MNIAFLGLGNMGKGMALNLLKANHEVNIYDINKDILLELSHHNSTCTHHKLSFELLLCFHLL